MKRLTQLICLLLSGKIVSVWKKKEGHMRINSYGNSYMNGMYQKKESSDNKNKDSSLSGLGELGGIQSSIMQKAVMDMEKDSVLHEYQYFVGSKVLTGAAELKDAKVISNDEDGVVLQLD